MKKVLVAPLDWGLGHATRCIPIILELRKRNCDVSIAGSGDSLSLLRNEFASLTFFSLPPYQPVYPSSGSMVWKMASQLPRFVAVIRQEHRQIERLIRENNIDLVISDNRYGCWSASIPSVFITHQRNIRMPKKFGWLTGLVRLVNEKMMKRFTVCWIPDYPDKRSLAGNLISVDKKATSNRVNYIGNLSRFKATKVKEIKYDVVCVFSGPEPQRTILENIVVKQVRQSGLRYFIVRGLISAPHPMATDTNCADFLNSEQLQSVMEHSTCVITRSGYSTVMDLATLGKKAIFIPTPGQTEQEYLAERLKKMRIAYSMEQRTFDINIAWEESKAYTGFHYVPDDSTLLKDALDHVLIIFSSTMGAQKTIDSTNKVFHEKIS